MKATKLLESQHKTVRKLFKSIKAASGHAEKGKLFEEVAACLVAHDAIEREILYPACEKKMGMTDLLGEALVEHGVIEFSLHVADGARGGDDFDHKVQVLSEMVEHHVKEEEGEFFPKVEKALGAELLETLGEKMEARFEEVKKADFRAPLQKKLEEVLAGASTAHAKAPAKGASHPKTGDHHA
jgi:hemerythrin superfamily protein